MGKLINKIVFLINSIVAFGLLLSYLLPYVSPKTFPLLSVLSLTVPIFIVINLIFLIYWIVLLNKRLILSLLVLILGFSHVSSLYKLSGKSWDEEERGVTLLSFNVRSFDRFDWIGSGKIPQNISALVKEQNPDIFCAQEFYNNPDTNFSQYPYKYENFNNDNGELALVVFSKFPIINKGSLHFKKTANNIIFSDLVINSDTIRVYNVHLQSHKISSNTDRLANEDSEKLLKRVQTSFERQQEQAEMLIKHMDASPYKNIVMGDFNNTPYSYVYNKIISNDLKDTFKEAGSGFGKTFEFDLFPLRIDFILIQDNIEVLEFKNFDMELSDHYPIFSRIKL
ncbi:endonuclease/exonuclease/phosphatase family protein [Aquimarina gracilis]|uniref:Endonuclease/exonuclease/phosphatase family protein n=1 Tax=Aquimarina gracilis TaxID=874422 RepID=A0ABU5ZYU3_9FLAO|nr:endonuclease/exonuclease/phosphatase family protein [Aquimarina gracilis]MEB3347063.1 endonuclease/exonuclease/phosphatase family protein [Aquimarina gracilis]